MSLLSRSWLPCAAFCLLAGVAASAGADAVIREYRGLTTPASSPQFGYRGFWKVNVAPDGLGFTGKLRLGSDVFVLKGSFDSAGNATFGESAKASRAFARGAKPAVSLSFSRAAGEGGQLQLTGVVQEIDGDRHAELAAAPALYVAATNPPAPYTQTPANLPGPYTIALPPKTPDEQGLNAGEFPQGYGVATMRISAAGRATLTGRLADGATVSCAGAITAGNKWPFYCPLYGALGSVLGETVFRDQVAISDLDGSELTWFRPRGFSSVRYPAGWPGGLKVDFLGAKYRAPSAAEPSVFPNLPPPSPEGNAQVTFTGGSLRDAQLHDEDPRTPISKVVNVTAANRINVLQPGSTALASRILANSGYLRSTFRHNASGAPTSCYGVVLQKQGRAVGYFIGAPN